MKFKEKKYYLTLNAEELGRVKVYLVEAHNYLLNRNDPTEDVDELLLQLMKLGKHRHKVKIG